MSYGLKYVLILARSNRNVSGRHAHRLLNKNGHPLLSVCWLSAILSQQPLILSRVSRLSAHTFKFRTYRNFELEIWITSKFAQLEFRVNLRYFGFTRNSSWANFEVASCVEHVRHLRESSFTSLTSSGPTDILHTCLAGGWYYFLARARNWQPEQIDRQEISVLVPNGAP